MSTNNVTKFKASIGAKTIHLDLETEFVDALKEISKMEELSIQELTKLIYRTSLDEGDFARAVRAFVITYYRNLALVLPKDYADISRSKLKDK